MAANMSQGGSSGIGYELLLLQVYELVLCDSILHRQFSLHIRLKPW
jgi:hypothetical protein